MQTRATLLFRLRTDGTSREVAWAEFHAIYSPIIARFARSRGVPASRIDELVQDVIAGFYAAQPRFQYDPAKGRFRAYLMACVTNAVRSAIRKTASLPRALPESDAIASEEQVDWDAAWKQSAIEEAVSRLRAQYHDNPTFQAFEAVVLRGQPPEVVAGALGMSRDSVYQAKARLLAKMRVELESVEREMEQQ